MGATVVRLMLQKPWTDRAKRSIVRPSVSTWRSAMRADPRKNDCATVTSTTATLPPPRHSHSRYSSSVCLPANWRTPAADLTYSKWPKLNLQMKTMMIITTSTECGLLLQTSWCSVVSVCLSVKSTSEPWKNGWTNRDCEAHSRGPKDHVLGPTRGPHGKQVERYVLPLPLLSVATCYHTVRQKKGTNFLLSACLLILDRNWWIFSYILSNV